MSLLIPLAAALIFACERPTHHDGDAIRCDGQERAMRLHAIDAPEMPGACRPGRKCTPGDPFAARDYLRALTRGRSVKCEEKDVDGYGRMVVKCAADGRDLGCAMVAAGHAVQRYGQLDCDGRSAPSRALGNEPVAPQPTTLPSDDQTTRYIVKEVAPSSRLSGWVLVLGSVALLLMNALGAALIWQDWQRARSDGKGRMPNPAMLAIAASGAATGMAAASLIFDHKQDEPRFNRTLILFAGMQIGIIAGLLLAR